LGLGCLAGNRQLFFFFDVAFVEALQVGVDVQKMQCMPDSFAMSGCCLCGVAKHYFDKLVGFKIVGGTKWMCLS